MNETIKTYKEITVVTEIDPCKAPEGCPELEPWMAYVGKAPNPNGEVPHFFIAFHGSWSEGYCGNSRGEDYAIDVRTEWAQEHFAEHCRIRNYQEPDAFEGFIKGTIISWDEGAVTLLREAYELGQANPVKK